MGEQEIKKAAEKYAKVLEKYGNDPNKMAEAYAELEEKLGSQGIELGDLRKKSEEASRTMQQYAQWVQGAKPVIDWYTQNQATVQQLWNQHQQGGARPATTASASSTSLLTPEEQAELIQRAAASVKDGVLMPWSQNFAKQAEDYVATKFKEMNEAFENKQKAFSSVLWKTMERGMPAEKVGELKQWHEEAMKYADRDKIDPLKIADDVLEARSKLSAMEAKVKEYEKEKEARDKASVPSLGNGQGLIAKGESGKTKVPQSRDERFAKVMGDLQETHGHDGVAALFGPR